ncbi:protocadherin Fat 4-like [Xenia sp. Carnegie-2017]|uniref:protocadherin Fat 4-like n=1 Tax=Xenia sp. Carnegie-2017 TaxID=2897299 RepID=UPI001F03F9E5|nr:protocadherin Fat 4-like [Xenia sp. Carnegie-2017]
MGNLKLVQFKVVSCCMCVMFLCLNYVLAARKTFYVDEGKAPGEFVGNLNRNITFPVRPKPKDFNFSKLGLVTSSVRLDREHKASYTFTVILKNGSFMTVDIHVRDVNDEFPTFSSKNKTVTISEAHSIGYVFNLDLYLSDKDIGQNTVQNDSVQIINGNNNDVFKLDLKKHGNMYSLSLVILKKLNWTQQSMYVLNLSASDRGIPRKIGYMSLTVLVEDYNDCYPEFSRKSYVADVSESVKKTMIILNVTTTDCDSGENAAVIYKMNYKTYDKNHYFSIQQHGRTGNIYTNIQLDYEKVKVYKLQVIAIDKGKIPKRREALITINVHDENDNKPEIGSFKFFPIREDAHIDTKVAEIPIRDKDSGENSRLNVSVSHTSLFAISKISHDMYGIHLKAPLDYEKQQNYLIVVTARDNGKPPLISQRSGTLRISDVNDIRPRFDQPFYKRDVNESVVPGTPILMVTATDMDEVSNRTYSILKGNYSFWFSINSSTGLIYVASFIDYEESSKVLLVVEVFDGKFTANCTVELTIIDTNDNPPRFLKLHYVMKVLENSKPGVVIGDVEAKDVDITSQGHIFYGLSVSADDIFAIKYTTGCIYVLKKLDREQINEYNFSVIAYDEDSLSNKATVTVIVEDVNDNPPFFEITSYKVEVFENVTVGTDLLKMKASDYDIGWNAEISYEITSGNIHDTFCVDKGNNMLSLKKELDRETTDRYQIKVRAIDNGGLTSLNYATVEIIVKDVNDDPPKFNKVSYSFDVEENCSQTVYVGMVSAKSCDKGSGAIISYSSKDAQQHFYVNDSGAIFAKPYLDYETQSIYELLITAQDHGIPPLSGFVNVTIHVLDINDNAPVWDDYSPCVKVMEDEAVGVVFHVFNAFDPDSGLNAKVSYSVVSAPENIFSLNSENGQMTLIQSIDYERVHFYNLILNASDSGVPIQWSLIKVNVCIIDVNDNRPILHNSSVTIKESHPIHESIYTFHAVDKDSGKNGEIWYKFYDMVNTDFFKLSRHGVLSLKKPLDREKQDRHNVTVLAGDLGSPILTSSPVTLTIIVEDVNDEAPAFTKNFRFITKEEQANQTVIGKVKAVDNDIGRNAEIEYSLVNCTDFTINPVTGEIKNNVILDREKIGVYEVQVRASDKGDVPLHSQTVIRIDVEDINDNLPKFTKTHYYESVAENQVIGSKVCQVKALDKDDGKNGEVSYFLNTGATQANVEMFQINNISGNIYLIRELKREVKELFVLSVIASDNGSPSLETVCSVFVTVLDVNEFKVQNDTIYISEKTPVGSVVYWANATDQDEGENGNITYSIAKKSSVFTIDTKSGGVILNKTLDYEKTKQYSLQIKASDGAKRNPKKNILRLYINVLHSNDNRPIFDENPINTNVSEGVPPGTKVHKPIIAKDMDSGINSRIFYSIESQTPKAAFIIDPLHGQLKTDVEIDREDVEKYSLTVKAVDQPGDFSQRKFSTVTVNISVLDINDCVPTFTSSNESFMMEDEPVNFTVFEFTAKDEDLGQGGNVSFSIVKGNEDKRFYLYPYGSMILLKALDSEKVDSYEFQIKATDHGSPPLSSTISFKLSVIDVNDNMPSFEKYIYEAQVLENKIGIHVLTVRATDKDRSKKLTYSLPAGYFNDVFIIDEYTGEISTNFPLDREKKDNFQLTVYVKDNGDPIYLDRTLVTVHVLDENDNRPTTLDNHHEILVPENSPLGYVYTIIAHDFDLGNNSRLQYSIYEGGRHFFHIDSNSGVISTAINLDRESISTFDLRIRIKDQGRQSLTTMTYLSIRVKDENDNSPEFNKSEIFIKLASNSQPGTEITTIKAKDKDEESNSYITYSFGSHKQIPFGLDSRTGKLYTLNYLNASKHDSYNFTVRASDGSKSGARSGIIKINVVVDQITAIPLRFTKTLYKIHLVGKIKANVKILQLQLNNEYLQPGDVEYTGSGQKVLAVGSFNGNVSFTEDPMSGAYLFSVKATLKYQPDMTAVCFVLVTVNRTMSLEKFSQSSYSATIDENYPTGKIVLRVKPTKSRNFTYEIFNGNDFDAFEIDTYGDIKVKNKEALDYERSHSFLLDVKGCWGNNITNIIFTKVLINIRCVYDKAPVCRQKVFISHINESSSSHISSNQFVTKLLAFSYNNMKVSFKIVSGNEDDVFLLVSSSGDLFLKKPVRYEEKNFYNLTINVLANSLSSTCYAHVHISDVNNNAPKLPKQLRFTIHESSLPGSHVGKINATDIDEYSSFTFQFQNKQQRSGPFLIDRYSGILRLYDAVDFEMKQNVYHLVVSVSDGLYVDQTNITVIVLDDNDHTPVFEKFSYYVKRQAPIAKGSLLARINATDGDEGNNKYITYGMSPNHEIGIHNKTGEVYTLTKILYNKHFVDVIITARDHGYPELYSQVPFRLRILFVNTIPPDLENVTQAIVPENAEVGTEVIKIRPLNSYLFAPNKRISFQILNGNALKMFLIEERTGIIRVRRTLDRETISLYNLEVIAKDGKLSVSNRIKVYITIGDVNDNSPIFKKNQFYESGSYVNRLSEDEKIGCLVLTVVATDKDIGNNGMIGYSISSGNSGGWFSINNYGNLRLASSLDRDVIPIHRLAVRATDHGTPPRASDISVIIYVADVNDNAPIFVSPKDLGVKENSVIGTYAGCIIAKDMDSGVNQSINYSIVGGTGLYRFTIERKTGKLLTLVEFDYEEKSSYTLIVKAQDLGSPPKSNNATVVVPIFGVDEFEPKFEKNSYEFLVTIKKKKNDIIGRVFASDMDDGPDGVVVYNLRNPPNDLVAVNNSTGVLYLTENVVDFFKRKRPKRSTDDFDTKYQYVIVAGNGKPDSKTSSVYVSIFFNSTVLPPENNDSSVSDSVRTTYIAIAAVVFAAIIILLILFFWKCRRKEGSDTKKASEQMVLRPLPSKISTNSTSENGLINKYGHVPTSGSNSLSSFNPGSSSSDNSCVETSRLNAYNKKKISLNNTDSGIQTNSLLYDLPDSNVHHSDGAISYDVCSDRTDHIVSHLQSIESLHDFDDEGGKEASAGLDVGNLLYAKCAEADAEENDEDRPRVFKFEGRPDYAGSLSSILGSHEELRGHYNGFYELNQVPQYQPLSEVFSEIGRLPINELETSMNDDISTRTSMLSSISSLHNQHLDCELTFSSLPMTPNFTPAFTPLLTRSPSLSPSTSEITTPVASPSPSRPSSMFLQHLKPSSSLIHLAEQEACKVNLQEDVCV